jgi:hypothetical protein
MVNDVEEALVLNPYYFICDIAGDRDKPRGEGTDI